MAEKTCGFGIIGVGMIGEFHARAIADLPSARLVAAADVVADRVGAFAAKHGCRGFTDVDALIADPEVDVITVGTPSGAHMEPVLAAAAAGKHVVCEKPMEITLERIDRMIAAHQKAGTVLAGIFQARFSPVNLLVKAAVAAGRFGRLTFASAYCPWWRTDAYYAKGGWKGTWRMDGGGALMNQSIHAIDALQWIVGSPVVAVSGRVATLAHPHIEVEDTAGAVVEFANGCLGLIQGATSMYPGTARRLEVSGDRGSVFCVEDTITTWQFADEATGDAEVRARYAKEATSGGSSDPAAISHAGHTACFASAMEAIHAGRPPAVSGPEARKAVEIILAIYESSRSGRRVELPL
ncbi:MAG: Myo-inositol 2-dehydrogenase [Phycisphaerae bacterium]|nr:Myo-inositol 2-dehydrogenase [Phycisphaerae bacterium]